MTNVLLPLADSPSMNQRSKREGRPKGKMADDIRFDCGVKIHTKGYRAYCQGRYTDDAEAYFTIWEEGAAKYYLTE